MGMLYEHTRQLREKHAEILSEDSDSQSKNNTSAPEKGNPKNCAGRSVERQQREKKVRIVNGGGVKAGGVECLARHNTDDSIYDPKSQNTSDERYTPSSSKETIVYSSKRRNRDERYTPRYSRSSTYAY